MERARKEAFLERWGRFFGEAELPIVFWYTDDEGSVDRAEPPKDHRCFLADLKKVRQGADLRFDLDSVGCSGGRRYLGFSESVRPNFEEFLSCGIPGVLA